MMGLSKSALTPETDRYIEYDFEQVLFRWDASSCTIFQKFYGEEESPLPIHHTNRLFFEALTYGKEITQRRYNETIEK